VTCSHCEITGKEFDAAIARADLKRYRRRGADAVTRKLIALVEGAQLVPGSTLLDVGGGIGAIHHHLLDHGVERVLHVDASQAYLAAAREEADRLGHADRVTFRHAEFRVTAQSVGLVDVVTLDRVVCCDPDAASLLRSAADCTRRLLAFSFPRRNWLSRLAAAGGNRWRALWGNEFRVYIHSPEAMVTVLQRAGLALRAESATLAWRVMLFERSARPRPISSRTPLSAF
jgi:2-polyprenyl-3-methyl-5-hydroxy-6-metoxy-1,4-benzoquinol methylase